MSAINVEFTSYITDLTHGALEQLKNINSSDVTEKARALAFANYTVGVLKMVRGKTVGNLKEDERTLLDAMIKEITTQLSA
ncbi:MAG: DUF1844 domain-containing protein [Myxococcota bacterium]|nr:DUF1844 domain-containing protein [Myxococcota bacterium]